MAKEVVSRSLSIFIDETNAAKAYDKLAAKQKTLTAAIEKGTAAGKDMTREIEKLGAVSSQMNGLKDVMEGKVRPSFTMTRETVTRLRNELSRMSEDAPGYAAKFAAFQAATAEFNRMKSNITGVRAAAKSLVSEIKTIALGVVVGNTIQTAVQAIAGYVTGIVSRSAKLSDELTDIEKTTGLTTQQVQKLNSELTRIDTRTSNSELRALAKEAGKLGKESVEDIRKFVEEADKIKVALGEDLGEEAITKLGKLSNIFKVDMINIASAINEIGNASEASESFQVDFLNRLAGVGPTARLSADELLGYGAALETLGQTAEVSGTALNQFFLEFVRDTEKFGKVAGFAKGELSKFVQDQGTNAAFIEFLRRLKETSGTNEQLARNLQKLNIDGTRGASVFLALANNIERVASQQQIANAAIKDGSSIVNEFNKRNNNLAAELDKLGKRLSSAFNSSAFASGLKNVAESINDVLEPGSELVRQLDRQQAKVADLEANLNPLTKRYNELKGQVRLNADESVELFSVMEEIVRIVPEAGIKWNEYGQVLDISTGKVEDAIKAQKRLALALNREAIEDLKTEIAKAQNQIATSQAIIDTYRGKGEAIEKRNQALINTAIKNVEKYKTVLLDAAIVLKQKFGAELPAALNEMVERETRVISDATKTAAIAPPKQTGQGTVIELTDEEKRALKERAEEIKRLRDELKKLQKDYDIGKLTEFSRQIAQINLQFEEMVDRARKLNQPGLIEEANKQRAQRIEDAYDKLLKNGIRIPVDIVDDGVLAKAEELIRKVVETFDKDIKIKAGNDADFGRKVQDVTARKTDENKLTRLRAELEEQQLIRQQRIENAKITGETILQIETDFANRSKAIQTSIDEEIATQNFITRVNKIAETAAFILSYFNGLNDAINNLQNSQLENDRVVNDKKKQSYQKLLDQKVISQKDYDKKIAALEEEQRKKEGRAKVQQFKRNQLASLAQAGINGAEGVTKTISTFGMPAAIPFIALVSAITAAQMALIAAQEAPKFAKGGFLPKGPSHQEGGIDLVDTRSRRRVGNIEGGEPIISKGVYAANKRLVDSLLQKGYAGDHTPLAATWMTSKPKVLNVSDIANSMARTGYFASGGILPESSGAAPADPRTQALLEALLRRLHEPFFAQVIYGDYEAVARRMQAIRDGGMLN
jgi:TP901 family phage tail tape measure protein